MAGRLARIVTHDPNVSTASVGRAHTELAARVWNAPDGDASERSKSQRASKAAGNAQGRMNVVFIVADDYRSSSMIYGKEQTYTPNLQRLAAQVSY